MWFTLRAVWGLFIILDSDRLPEWSNPGAQLYAAGRNSTNGDPVSPLYIVGITSFRTSPLNSLGITYLAFTTSACSMHASTKVFL